MSAWIRDLSDIEHSKLYRNDPRNKLSIVGTQFVYGKGDAIALSYLYQALEKIGLHNRHITIEDSDQMTDFWGRSAICLGAHNLKTREILEKFHNPYFKFDANYRVIIKADDLPITNDDNLVFKRGVFQATSNDSSEIDYGIILKLKDEYFPDKNIIVIAGLSDISTAGCAFFILSHFDQLPYEDETFGVLIEVPSGYESARLVDFDKVATNFTHRKES